MAELTSRERLQPSLLDRLTDDEPAAHQEARDRRVLSLRRLREGVLRDLAWLLNTVHMEATEDLDPHPEVARSVLNFGMPDLSGQTSSGLNIEEMQREIQQAIQRFEPRILPKSLKVVVDKDTDLMSHNSVRIRIEGDLWAQPLPEKLYLKTVIDMETGNAIVQETAGAARSDGSPRSDAPGRTEPRRG